MVDIRMKEDSGSGNFILEKKKNFVQIFLFCLKMDYFAVQEILEKRIPLELAEKWYFCCFEMGNTFKRLILFHSFRDNVGTLVLPPSAIAKKVQNIMLCIDLTTQV
jgi:hypothetical protein